MHKRTNIKLKLRDHALLEAVVANRNSPQKHVWRARIAYYRGQYYQGQNKIIFRDDSRKPTSAFGDAWSIGVATAGTE